MRHLRSGKRIITKAARLLRDKEKGHDPNVLQEILDSLNEVGDLLRNDVQSNDTLVWLKYLCLRRLQRYTEAISVLYQVWDSIEDTRGRISDVRRRGGMLRQFPRLFHALAKMLHRSGQPLEMLAAIEAGRGRFLYESTIDLERPVARTAFSSLASQIVLLMQREQTHFLSILPDEEETYAVLVTSKGAIHTAELPITEGVIGTLMPYRDPQTWGKKKSLRGTRNPNVSEALAPLVNWLEPLFDSGELSEGDHICYSPGGVLQLFPLQYMAWKGGYLGMFFSLSRVLDASVLVDQMKQPSTRPSQFASFEVPSSDELGEDHAAKREAFHQVSNWLQAHARGRVLQNEEVQTHTFADESLDNRVVHCATHGIFDEAFKANPYTKSGLLVASGGTLPRRITSLDEIQPAHLLSPKKFMEMKPDLSKSHVTLQACVSGLAKEGVGRDQLGLEWALTFCGVDSLLSTHWNVSIQVATEFSMLFYQKWMIEGTSRARAWHDAMKEIYTKYPHKGAAYWSAFTLTGDWR